MPPTRSPLAQALRVARQTTGLTQGQLGQRLGLKGRAIYRWERDESRPTLANQQRVLALITSLHQPAAAKLSAAITGASPIAMQTASPASETAPVAPRTVVEHSVFTMADELDLPARRMRGALARWLRRVREANLTLADVQCDLDGWIADAE